MAQVMAVMQNGDFIIRMKPAEAKKISGNANIANGAEFNLNPVYNKLQWLVANQGDLTTLVAQVRAHADGIETAVNLVT
jgi:hypothetical protein